MQGDLTPNYSQSVTSWDEGGGMILSHTPYRNTCRIVNHLFVSTAPLLGLPWQPLFRHYSNRPNNIERASQATINQENSSFFWVIPFSSTLLCLLENESLKTCGIVCVWLLPGVFYLEPVDRRMQHYRMCYVEPIWLTVKYLQIRGSFIHDISICNILTSNITEYTPGRCSHLGLKMVSYSQIYTWGDKTLRIHS